MNRKNSQTLVDECLAIRVWHFHFKFNVFVGKNTVEIINKKKIFFSVLFLIKIN